MEGLESREFRFEYDCEPKSVRISVYRSLFEFYNDKNKIVFYNPQEPDDWRTRTYLQYLGSSHDEPVISELIEGIRSELVDPDDDELVLAAVSLVQNLEYDCDKYWSYESDDGQDYQTNYPYETMYLESGVCGDFSLLLGKILQQLGYGAALLSFSDADHMAVGIQCPLELANYQKEGIGYCYIETTAPSRIGRVPEFVNTVRLNESDLLIKISDGKTFQKIADLVRIRDEQVEKYGEFILELSACAEVADYIHIRELEFELEDCTGSLHDLELKIEPIQQALEDSNQEFTALGCKEKISSLYEVCRGIFDTMKDQNAEIASLAEEYNAIYTEYLALREKYQQDLAAFNLLFENNHQNCPDLAGAEVPVQE